MAAERRRTSPHRTQRRRRAVADLHLAAAVPALALSALLAACTPGAPPVRDWPTEALRPGGTVEAELAVGEEQRWRLPLPAGHFLHLVVEQQGIDAAVALGSADGTTLLTVDRPTRDTGPELLLALTGAAGDYLLTLRGAAPGPGRYAARIETLQPATERDRRLAAAYRRLAAAQARPAEEAQAAREELGAALAVWRETGEPALAGETLYRLGGRAEGAEAAVAAFRDAAAAFAEAGDRRWEGLVRTTLGAWLFALDRETEAADEYRAAAALAGAVGDRYYAAKAEHGLGQVHRYWGELQEALDHYRAAVTLWPEDVRLRIYTLHNLGVLHARFLGDPAGGIELLEQAEAAWWPGEEANHASTLNQLGQLAYEAGRPAEARGHFLAARELAGERHLSIRATAAARLAVAEAALGDRAAAAQRWREAEAALAEAPSARTEARLCQLGAELAERLDEPAEALDRYHRCTELYSTLGDRSRLAWALEDIARLEHARGEPAAALVASRQALEIFEGVRPTLLREDLRRSYFTAAQAVFDLHIELLVELGRPAEAWVAAERARARALRDLLTESGHPAVGIDPALAARDRDLQRRLNRLERRRDAVDDPAELPALLRQLDDLVAELETVRGEIRRRGPAFASHLPDGPQALATLLATVDPDRLLLEYRLGDETSHLWAVQDGAVEHFPLPPRRRLEELARQSAAWLHSLDWPGENPPPVCDLASRVLAPVAGRLAGRPLVVVADGALEGVPFAALPDPAAGGLCATAPPLIAGHEISYLPSAATLAGLRRRHDGRRPAPGWLAVVADPIYDAGDERLPPGAAASDGAADAGLRRLPGSGEEAAALLALVPPDRGLVASGFDASTAVVAGDGLGSYRLLHFATHGVLDSGQPLLSRLVLSRFDAAGRPQDGVLAAHDIYRLDLPAELVTLSACDTALGNEQRGEGVVAGLPRAFLYAGAQRVLVSLWTVPDRGSRDLMIAFYRGLLADGLPPARALQQAQVEMWRAGRPPLGWAGFVLQGDPRPLPVFGE